MREKFHRKKLYCPWCQEMHNTIEVKNQQEEFDFHLMYSSGEFIKELETEDVECPKLCF